MKHHCMAVHNHAAKPIRKPKLDKNMVQCQEGLSLIVHFYGGKYCIGFVLYRVDGSPYVAVGDVDDQWSTNSLAELAALE